LVWTSVAEVNATIPVEKRHPGLPVYINNVLYRYKNGVQDSDLVIDNPTSVITLSDRLITAGQVIQDGNTFTFTALNNINYQWLINNELYTNTLTEIDIDFSELGKERFDLFFVTNDNEIKSRSGIEVEVGELVSEPILNPNEIKIGLIKVSDSTTGPVISVSTEDFVRKSFTTIVQPQIIDGIISLSEFGGGETNFDIVTPNVQIKGVTNVQSLDQNLSIFPGKKVIFRNKSGQAITILHNISQVGLEVNFTLQANQDLIIPNKGIAIFDYDENDTTLYLNCTNFGGGLTSHQIQELQDAYEHSQEIGNPHNTQYSELGGIPSTFTPSAHTHTLSQITDAGALASLNQVNEAQIVNHAVTNTKLAQMNANTVKGRLSGNGTPQDIPMADLPISTAQASVNASKVDKEEVELTPTAGVITIDSTYNYKSLILNVGSTDTTVNLIGSHTLTGLRKKGDGLITINTAVGRNLVTLTSTNNMIEDGATGLLFSDGTNDYISINEGYDALVKKSQFKNGTENTFTLVGSDREVNIGFLTNYPDSNYDIVIRFDQSILGFRKYGFKNITNAGFTLVFEGTTDITSDVIWTTFRPE
jgi:hypothetical protein